MRSERLASIASVAAAAVAIAAIESGHPALAARCPDADVADGGRIISRSGNRNGVKRFGRTFDACSPNFLVTPMVPTNYPPHSGKNSQPADKKQLPMAGRLRSTSIQAGAG